MTTKLSFSLLDVGKGGGFYSNGVTPAEVFRHPGRIHIGDGWEFEGATRGNNTNLNWVHTYSTSNEFFVTSADTLVSTINSSVTSITLSGVTGLTTSGYVKIDEEIISYASIAGNILNGCVRGRLGTTAASHTAGAIISKAQGPYGSANQYLQTQAKLDSITSRGIALSGLAVADLDDVIGHSGVAVLRAGGLGRQAWGGYSQGDRELGTFGLGSVWAHEFCSMNMAGETTDPNKKGGSPYNQGFAGQTLGVMIQSGSGATNSFRSDNPLAITVGKGGFFRGIVFEDGAIRSASGFNEAVLMPSQHVFSWYGEVDHNKVLEVGSTITEDTYAQQLIFNDFGMNYRIANGNNMFSVDYVPNATNGVAIQAGTTGIPARVKAKGTDTNIDLMLQPQGTGVLRFSYAASAATTPANFNANRRVQMKDGSGNIVYVAASTTAW